MDHKRIGRLLSLRRTTIDWRSGSEHAEADVSEADQRQSAPIQVAQSRAFAGLLS